MIGYNPWALTRAGSPPQAAPGRDAGRTPARERTSRWTAPQPGGVPDAEFARSLAQASRAIDDPVARLRFLRSSMHDYEPVRETVQALPGAPVRRMAYRALRLAPVRDALLAGQRLARSRALARLRQAALVAALFMAVSVLVGLGWARRAAPARAAAVTPTSAPPATAHPAASLRAQAPVAEPLPVAAAPAEVWRVEKGADFELYSNGLRIETRYATDGPERRFRPFDPQGHALEELRDTPVGLLFHTSESDIWPMEAGYNESLRDSSQRLLRYIRRERLYNYVIDRFGQVYRIVEEIRRAHHAGHSIWQAGERIYLNLNSPFLGVCFESRWDGGRALPITQAQLQAGRQLTDYLRQRWKLTPDMCVTHGLVSVNPQKHLIGHHVDWARGFPFEAFGLPDHYARASPAVALFGFGYDDDFTAVVGEPWEGVRTAERDLADEARASGCDLSELRQRLRARYHAWLGAQGQQEALPAGLRPVRAGVEAAGGGGAGGAR